MRDRGDFIEEVYDFTVNGRNGTQCRVSLQVSQDVRSGADILILLSAGECAAFEAGKYPSRPVQSCEATLPDS